MPASWRVVAVPLLAVVLLAACVSTNLAPIGSAGRFTPEDDEGQLWRALRQAEDSVLPQSAVYEDDADLKQYLAGLVRRVIPDNYIAAGGQPIQVKVRKDPRLNAGAMAHGLIIVNSGMLARAENEAQLAGVLAHEVAHITHRHQVREQRHLQNRRTAANVAAFLGTLALAAAAVDQSIKGNYATAQALTQAAPPLLTLGLNLTYSAMVTGYSRDMEREADEQAVKAMAAAGYPPNEFAGLLRRMMAENPNQGPIETFFWGSHPRTAERIKTVEQSASTTAVTGRSEGGTFDRRTAKIRFHNATWDAYLGRWNIANTQVARVVAVTPSHQRAALETVWDGDLHTAASIGARRRNNETEAEAHYRAARARYGGIIASSGSLERAVGYRGLGRLFLAHREHQRTDCEAKAAFAKYIELSPTAPDRATVEKQVAEINCSR